MQISTGLSVQLQKFLDLSSEQLKLTASNMANIDTPSYKTRGFDFDSVMRTELSETSRQSSTHRNDQEAAIHSVEVDGLIARPDGNNVSMDREGIQLAEAQLKFRSGVELIKREYTRISDAIHSDAK